MLIAIITWSSLVLALAALGVAILGIVRMRAEDALAAARGRIIMIIGAVAALLFFVVFVVGFMQMRRPAPQAPPPAPAVGTPEPSRGFAVRDDARPRPSPGTVVVPVTERITALSPAEGIIGRIVSILGAGFGVTPGKVRFIDSRGTVTEATTALPSECTATPWSDTVIFILVPQLSVGVYDVTVERAGGGGVMNRIPFRVTNIGSRTSLCRVDPDHGIPSVTTVTIVGSEFGSAPGKVFFGNVPATHLTSWAESAIQVRVPVQATSGNMRVVTSGGIRSNETPFTIGQCTATSCAAGQTCCADGLCRGEGTCPVGSGACTYRWFFSTGATLQAPCGPNGSCPTGFQCAEDSQTCRRVANPPCGPGGACAYGRVCDGQTNTCVPVQCGPGDTCPAGLACDRATRTCAPTSYPPCGGDGQCPQGLTCNRATNTCTPNGNPPCAADGSCGAGRTCNAVTRTCDPVEGPRACSRDAECTSGQYCSAATGRCIDGTPRLVEEQGCTNTMQSPTPYRGRIDACTNAWFGARFSVPLDGITVNGNTIEVRACGTSLDFSETACTIRVAGDLETVPGQDGIVGFTMKPRAALAPGTWYSVLVHRDVRSRVGVPLPQDLEWHTRTGTSACTMDHVEVFPSRAVVASIGDAQGYSALATATNCNLITHGGPYAWESKDATRVAVTPPDARTTAATALQGTTAAGVQIAARVGAVSDSGVFVVRLDAPLVVDVWPSCAAACRNAELGIRFSLPMRPGTLSSRTVHLDTCTDTACTKSTAVPIGAVQPQEDGIVFTFAPSRGSLAPATLYRVALDRKSIQSRDGVVLGGGTPELSLVTATANSVSWTFRTLDTRAVCTLDRVAVTPSSATLTSIFARASFAAVARSKSDACDSQGQRLVTTGFPWSWASSNEGVAPIVADEDPKDAIAHAESRIAGTSAISAETSSMRAAGQLSVLCVAASDQDCGSASSGLGTDRCCYPRPTLLRKRPEGTNVCRNGTVELTFDQPMDTASVERGVIVEVEVPRVSCAPNAPLAPRGTLGAFCPLPVGVESDALRTSFTVSPRVIVEKATQVRVRVRGASDAGGAPVKNERGVAMGGTTTWSYTTGDNICSIRTVEMRRDAASGPLQSDRFLCMGRDDCPDDASGTTRGVQHRFTARALDRDGHEVQARFSWSVADATILTAAASAGAAQEVTAEKNGHTTVTVHAEAVDPRGGRGDASLPVTVQACANPWPPLVRSGTQSTWEPFADRTGNALPRGSTPTNFETWYCRDRGAPTLDDDLPALTWPPAFETGTAKPDFLKGYLFQIVGGAEPDAIGVEVFGNPSMDLLSWYRNLVATRPGGGTPESIRVDGYPALRDGRTVYIQAPNIHDNRIYTNVYLVSTGLGASESTVEVARLLLENMRLTTTLTNGADRAALARDIVRLLSLRNIRERLDARTGGAPTLPAGSFIPNVTFSSWPTSWGRLAGLLGGALPTDPVNRFVGCAAPYDASTCWDPVRRKFKCPSGAHVFGYRVDANGRSYTLAAQFEYTGPGSMKNDSQFWTRERFTRLEDLLKSPLCTP